MCEQIKEEIVRMGGRVLVLPASLSGAAWWAEEVCLAGTCECK